MISVVQRVYEALVKVDGEVEKLATSLEVTRF